MENIVRNIGFWKEKGHEIMTFVNLTVDGQLSDFLTSNSLLTSKSPAHASFPTSGQSSRKCFPTINSAIVLFFVQRKSVPKDIYLCLRTFFYIPVHLKLRSLHLIVLKDTPFFLIYSSERMQKCKGRMLCKIKVTDFVLG